MNAESSAEVERLVRLELSLVYDHLLSKSLEHRAKGDLLRFFVWREVASEVFTLSQRNTFSGAA